jgi:Holliday junction resolvasome RuvABC endonuclease subunit
MRILSLDISTSTIGLAILDYCDGYINLIHSDYFKPPKTGSIFSRLSASKQYIKTNLDKYEAEEVAIEDYACFMKGKSSAITIISLAILNRTLGLFTFEHMNKEPILYNVNTVRSVLRNYIGKDIIIDRIAKDQIPNVIEKILNINFPWRMKENKRNKQKSIAEESYDCADAIAVGIAHIIKTMINQGRGK